MEHGQNASSHLPLGQGYTNYSAEHLRPQLKKGKEWYKGSTFTLNGVHRKNSTIS